MVHVDWDERYQGGLEQRPWDIGSADAELQQCIEEDLASESVRRALEIGCGTGTNAIWLAERGIEVLGTEIAPTAIAEAEKKTAGKDLPVRFVAHNIVEGSPVAPGTMDFAFDRGVFHVMAPEQRGAFVKHVAQALRDGGWWLCLAGSKDESKPEDRGPPRLSAGEVILAVENDFEVYSLRRIYFGLPDGSQFAAWRGLYRKRT